MKIVKWFNYSHLTTKGWGKTRIGIELGQRSNGDRFLVHQRHKNDHKWVFNVCRGLGTLSKALVHQDMVQYIEL